jgi:hypothetical protein
MCDAMLSVVRLTVIRVSVVMLSSILLTVVAPVKLASIFPELEKAGVPSWPFNKSVLIGCGFERK